MPGTTIPTPDAGMDPKLCPSQFPAMTSCSSATPTLFLLLAVGGEPARKSRVKKKLSGHSPRLKKNSQELIKRGNHQTGAQGVKQGRQPGLGISPSSSPTEMGLHHLRTMGRYRQRGNQLFILSQCLPSLWSLCRAPQQPQPKVVSASERQQGLNHGRKQQAHSSL